MEDKAIRDQDSDDIILEVRNLKKYFLSRQVYSLSRRVK